MLEENTQKQPKHSLDDGAGEFIYFDTVVDLALILGCTCSEAEVVIREESGS